MSTYHCKPAVKAHDPVNHPSHYCRGGIEVLDAIEAWELDYHRGNSIKYIARAGYKDPSKEVEDLKKARFYLVRKVEQIKKGKKRKKHLRPLAGVGLLDAIKAWGLPGNLSSAVEMIVLSRFGDRTQEAAMLSHAVEHLTAQIGGTEDMFK